jgi:hypothetical protein
MTNASTNTNLLLGEEPTSTTPTAPPILEHFSETSSGTDATSVRGNDTGDQEVSQPYKTIDVQYWRISHALATETVIREHYLHRKCPISYSFGAFVGDELKGVLTVGVPASWSVRAGLVGDTYKTYKNSPHSRANDVHELNRLWMSAELPRNSESRFVGWCLRELRRQNPSMILVSYADGSMGHVGYIYQACNFFYTGTSAPFKDIHPAGYSDCRRVSMSVRGEKVGNKRAWALDPNIPRRVRSPKHRYVFFMNRRDIRILAWQIQPYPKVAASHEKSTPLASGAATGIVSSGSDAMGSLPDPGVEVAPVGPSDIKKPVQRVNSSSTNGETDNPASESQSRLDELPSLGA